MAAEPQGPSNHARYVAGYHYVLFAILLVILGWAVTMFVRRPGVPTLVGLLLAIGLVLMSWYMRIFAMTVQDRVIRLEERLRMEALLPTELKSRIPEFSLRQLVALRFASDAELPALARRVPDEKLTDQKEIKRLIKAWRADHLRV